MTTVTATQGGSTANGMLLRVFVLTGAKTAANQTGASFNNQFTNVTAFTGSITTVSGSNVYGAAAWTNPANAATGSNTTIVDDVADTTNGEEYVTFKALNVAAGALTRGATAAATASGPMAMLEILAATTLAEDASSPAQVNTTGAGPVVTASFTPPAGSLLVAIISSDGGAGVTTFSVSGGGGGTWTEKVVNNPGGGDYAAVWIADGPAAATVAGTVQPRATIPVPRRKPARAAWARITGQAFVQVPAPAQEFRLAPRRIPARAIWRGITGPAFVKVPAPKQQPAPAPRRKPGRAVWRGLAVPGQVPVAPRQAPYLPSRRPARAVWRGSAPFTGFVAVPAPRQPPPTVFRRIPARGYWRGGAGPLPVAVPVAALRQPPVFPRRRPARAVVQFRAVTTVNAPFVPRGQPPQAPDDKPYLKKLYYLTG